MGKFMDKTISEIAAKIKEEKIRDLFLAAVANSCVEKVESAAASSTGKYHPRFAHGEGGLLRHIRAAVHFVERLAISNGLSSLERDIAIAAAGLHDLCKSGLNWESKYTVFEHPLLVRCLIDSEHLNGQDAVLWSQICDCIDSHMGCWNKPTERDIEKRLDEIIEAFKMTGRSIPDNLKSMSIPEIQNALAMPTPKTTLQIVVATADYMAADKQLSLTGIFDDESQYWEAAMATCEAAEDEPATEKQRSYILALYGKLKEKGESSKWDWLQTANLSKKKASGVIHELQQQVN